jgi:hypothetical protein
MYWKINMNMERGGTSLVGCGLPTTNNTATITLQP